MKRVSNIIFAAILVSTLLVANFYAVAIKTTILEPRRYVTRDQSIANLDDTHVCMASLCGTEYFVTDQNKKNEVTEEVVNYTCCKPCPPCIPCQPIIRPCYKKCCDRVIANFDLLFWRGATEGLDCDFVTFDIFDSTSGAVTTSLVEETENNPDFSWNLGFRTGFSYLICCSPWRIDAYWTHYRGSAHRHPDVTTNSGSWKLAYDLEEISVDYDVCLSRCFSLTPYVGVRIAEINQTLQAHFITRLHENGTITDFFSDRYSHQNFWGAGPAFGFYANWKMRCNLILYGGIGSGFLYGRTIIHSHNEDFFPNSIDMCRGVHNVFNSQPLFDFELGLAYAKCICCRTLFLKLALEHHRIWNHGHMSCKNGTLTLDGVTFGLGLQF